MSNSFATPWTVSHQAPLSMGFLKQENWNGLPFPASSDLPNSGIEPIFPKSPAGGFFTTESLGKPTVEYYSAVKNNEIMPFAAKYLGAPKEG